LLGNFSTLDAPTAAIGIVTLAILFEGSRRAPRVPWALVVVVAGIALSHVLGLAERGISVVGPLPAGLPVPGLPAVSISELGALVVSGGALALVGIAEGLSAAVRDQRRL
jgi:SulP family sulfate permease